MAKLDKTKNLIRNLIHETYREFALEYSRIQKSNMTEEEKQAEIIKLMEITKERIHSLENTMLFDEISEEKKEDLGIKDPEVQFDEKVVDTLVDIFAKRAKMPPDHDGESTLEDITLEEDEELEDIDTTEFESELREYFIEHYKDLISSERSNSLKENEDIIKIVLKYEDIDPDLFKYFNISLLIQEGLVAEETLFDELNIFYATPEAINRRLFDIYSEILFKEQQSKGRDLARLRKLKNEYITYAEKNDIEIENPDVLETIDIDMNRVQKIASYINQVINKDKECKKGDYIQQISDDIIKNYSKIMSLDSYDFKSLDSVKEIADKSFSGLLKLRIGDDYICTDGITTTPVLVYATPDYIKQNYPIIMEQVDALHETNAFVENNAEEICTLTAKKHAYRKYIKENHIEGIDTSIPQVGIENDRIEMIADALIEEYGKDYENKEEIRNRIIAKLTKNWSEIKTESQVVRLNELFVDELDQMCHQNVNKLLYVQNDFIYLEGIVEGFQSKVIYATENALERNIQIGESLRYVNTAKAFIKYAKEHGFDMDKLSVLKKLDEELERIRKERYVAKNLCEDYVDQFTGQKGPGEQGDE